MPKLAFIGWKLAEKVLVIKDSSAPIMVVGGGVRGFPPFMKRLACIPAIRPMAADSIYPSTPVICPAKKMRGLFFNWSVLRSREGEWM